MTVLAKTPKGDTCHQDFPLILPHKLLGFLAHVLPLKKLECDAFWQHMEAVHDPWALSSSAWRSDHEVWPVGLYGDEASMGFVGGGPVEKIIGLFLNIPLHRPASTRLSRFLIFSISSEYVVSAQDTFYPVFDAIVRSLNAASTGVDPDTGAF